MKLPNTIELYGNTDYRNKKCPKESAEQVTFFNWLRREYPDSYGLVATHIRNEGKRSHAQTAKQSIEGMVSGAPDIIIPARITFLCELKRKDHTLCKIGDNQISYLNSAKKLGSFSCVALGSDYAKKAFLDWLDLLNK